MKQTKIRTKPTTGKIEIGGWLGNWFETYLWFGLNGECIGILDRQKLYRLAKAIVRHMETDK